MCMKRDYKIMFPKIIYLKWWAYKLCFIKNCFEKEKAIKHKKNIVNKEK